MSTSSTDNIFLRYSAGLTTRVALLLVLVNLARYWSFSRLGDDGPAAGCAELAFAYLLILPASWQGTKGVVAVMFTYVGLLGAVQLLFPEHAILLGGFAVGTQLILTAILLLAGRKTAS